MNSLKSLFVVAVLAALACGAYVSLNRNNDAPPPTGTPAGIPGPPRVQIPPMGTTGGPPSDGINGIGATPGRAAATPFDALTAGSPGGNLAAANKSPGAAAAFVPPDAVGRAGTTAAPAPSGGEAPPFVPPAAGQASGARSTGPASGLPSAAAPIEGAGAASGPGGTHGDPSAAKRGSLALPSDTMQRYASPPEPARQSTFHANFESVMRTVAAKLDARNVAEAHEALSSLYGDPDLPPEEARQINRTLDQMAATVIYSRQHLLEPKYNVQPGDTLEGIAEKYSVPPQLIARINGVREGGSLPPGRELKVVRGPFSALIDLDKFELTLMLKGRYAGRFPIGIGIDNSKLVNTYVVRDKRVNPAYEGAGGTVAPDDPNNPLGKLLIDLGNRVAIHGTNNPQNIRRADGHGTICLSDRDMEDVFGILSVGSRVVIQK